MNTTLPGQSLNVTQWQAAEWGDVCRGCGISLHPENGGKKILSGEQQPQPQVYAVYSDASYEKCLGIFCDAQCPQLAGIL